MLSQLGLPPDASEGELRAAWRLLRLRLGEMQPGHADQPKLRELEMGLRHELSASFGAPLVPSSLDPDPAAEAAADLQARQALVLAAFVHAAKQPLIAAPRLEGSSQSARVPNGERGRVPSSAAGIRTAHAERDDENYELRIDEATLLGVQLETESATALSTRAGPISALRLMALAAASILVAVVFFRGPREEEPQARVDLETVSTTTLDELGVWHVRAASVDLRGQWHDVRDARELIVRKADGSLAACVVPDEEGHFELNLPISDDGNLFRIHLGDAETSVRELRVHRDPRAPLIVKTYPDGAKPTRERRIDFEVWVQEENLSRLVLDGRPLRRHADGHFIAEDVQLTRDGHSRFTLEASDDAGNQTRRVISLEHDARAPRLAGCAPQAGSMIERAQPIELMLAFDEPIQAAHLDGIPMSVDPDGRSARRVLVAHELGPQAWAWRADDLAGNRAEGILRFESLDPVSVEWNALAFAPSAEGVHYTTDQELHIAGRVQAARSASVAAVDPGGQELARASLDQEGRFDLALPLRTDELVQWRLQTQGLPEQGWQHSICDEREPHIEWLEPALNQPLAAELVALGEIDLRIRLDESYPAWVRCGSHSFVFDHDDEWIARGVSIPNDGVLQIEASDLAGSHVSQLRQLDIDRVAPTLLAALDTGGASSYAARNEFDGLGYADRLAGGPDGGSSAAGLELRFDEPLISLSIGGHHMALAKDGDTDSETEVINVALEVFSGAPAVDLPWHATDRFGNASAGTLTLPEGWTLASDAAHQDAKSGYGELPAHMTRECLLLDASPAAHPTRQLPQRLLHRRTGVEFVYVPPGSFGLGDDRSASADEGPEREVEITGFYMALHEVSRIAYERGGGLLSTASGASDSVPATEVSWHEADAWCRGLGLRLPSEAQWEYAAAGPQELRFPWGDEWRARACNAGAASEDDFDQCAPIGSFVEDRSWCGIVDLAGNVSEWCSDVYRPYEEWVHEGQIDPRQGEGEEHFVERGGSFMDEVPTRNSYRFGYSSEGTHALGFRPVLLP
ncbi:MAG: sulfatase activating formylglycine-generating enzyme [Planctomycetota bacterium]|jgi:formylglycine-generating enzyme required for sulfatase activity